MKRPTSSRTASRFHRLPEGRAEWQLDLPTRDRALAGIALAREALRAARRPVEVDHEAHATAA